MLTHLTIENDDCPNPKTRAVRNLRRPNSKNRDFAFFVFERT